MSIDGAHRLEVESSHYQVSCSTSADGPTAIQPPADQSQSPIHAGELLPVDSSNRNLVAAELPRMTSADGAPAPLRGFDGWLDDLYDDNGLFNEDLGVSRLPDR